MNRMQPGLFFLFLLCLMTRQSSCTQSCSITLINFEHQYFKLHTLLPDPAQINNIVWNGLLDTKDLKMLLGQVPCMISCKDLKKFIFYCAAARRYKQVIFTLKKDQLIITLIPNLIFDRCMLEGNLFGVEGIKHEYLIKPGMVFDERLRAHALKQLKKTYQQKGFLDVRVCDRLQKHEQKKSVSIELEIQKGLESGLCNEEHATQSTAITFEGNKNVSHAKLHSLISLYGDALTHIPAHVLIDTIANWYHAHGYAQARVTVQVVTHGFRIMIDEGHFEAPALVFAADQPKAHHTFGATVLKKISQLPDEYIMREIQYADGQKYAGQAIADTLKRLNKLQIFDRVHLHPIVTPFDENQYTMELQVRDDLPREMRTRTGMSLQQMSKEFSFKNITYAAGGTFLFKNPTNHADLFFIDADYTYGEQILSAHYWYPWIHGWPIDARFQVYAMQYLQPGLRHNHKNIYSFAQQGALMGLQYQKGDWDAQINYGLEWMETKLKNCTEHPLYCKELSRALNFTPLLLDKKIPYLFTEPSIVVDRLDDQLNPSQGTLTLFTAKAMMPCKYLSLNSSFLKILFDHAYFVPFRYGVLATRMRAGHIFFHHFENIMPAERFYMGGANSIRSYETDLCPPLGIVLDKNNQARFVPQGAQSMIALNVELRIPAKKSLWFALFQDLGALSNTKFADIKMEHILAGTGAGIRIQTPIGPLRFDFAFKWHLPDQVIAPYCWFLSFGNAF